MHAHPARALAVQLQPGRGDRDRLGGNGGRYLQAGYSFARIENALSFVVASMESFSALATGTDRLYDLFLALDLAAPPSPARSRSLLSTLLLMPPPSSTGAAVKDKTEDTPRRRDATEAADAKPLLSESAPEDVPGWSVVGGGGAGTRRGPGEVMRRGLDAGGAEGVLLRISRLHVRAPSMVRRGLAELGVPGVAGGAWEQGYLVADELALTVTRGMTVLLMGPSGCGKSSLLRVIAGLWTHGRGEIECVSGKVRALLLLCPAAVGDAAAVSVAAYTPERVAEADAWSACCCCCCDRL